jgi:hypothetical protein
MNTVEQPVLSIIINHAKKTTEKEKLIKNINLPKNQNRSLLFSHTSARKVEQSPDYLHVNVKTAFRSTSPTRGNVK